MATKIEIYKDTADEWRWRLIHSNGNVLADSSEGYVNKGDMLEVIENIRGYMETSSIKERK